VRKIKIGGFSSKSYIGNDESIIENNKARLIALIVYTSHGMIYGMFAEYLITGGKITQGHLFGETSEEEQTLEIKRAERVQSVQGGFSNTGVHFLKITTTGGQNFVVGDEHARGMNPYKTFLGENETLGTVFC
jgi:hypothetical protein